MLSKRRRCYLNEMISFARRHNVVDNVKIVGDEVRLEVVADAYRSKDKIERVTRVYYTPDRDLLLRLLGY